MGGYAYAADNPVTNSDPTGMVCAPDDPYGCPGHSDGGSGEGSGGGSGGGTTGSGGSCPDYDPGCPGFMGGGGPLPLAAPAAQRLALPSAAQSGACTGGWASRFSIDPCAGGMWGTGNGGSSAPSWLIQGLLGVGAVGLTVVNFLQGGLDPLTDAAEFADVAALTADTGDTGDSAASAVADSDAAPADDAVSCGGMSFTAGTKVLLASGAAIPISQLKIGDKILATNVKTGKTRAEPIAAGLLHYDTDRYNLKIKTADGTAIIHTTSRHLFWDQTTRRWTKAVSLGDGERLHVAASRASVAVIGGYSPRQRAGWMWDLSVPGGNDHDFYVDVAATAVLVHNCNVYRTARLGSGQAELENGLDPQDFSTGDRSAYAGDEAAARTLANPDVGSYENFYTRFEMHPDFEGEFAKFQYPYAEGGPGSYEYQIPQDLIPRFNELTIERAPVQF